MKMKKIISLVLAMMMVIAIAVPAFAYSTSGNYSTKVEDEEYYKKFYGQGIEINVCNWGEFLANDPVNFVDVNKDFEELTGIKVNYTLFSTNEELYAKMRAGAANYDVIVPSDYMIGRMISEGMLKKINFDNVPNYKNVDETYKNANFDPNNEYSVPLFWGIVGIIYNKDMVDEADLTGWDVLWNPKYSGNMLMFSNSRDAFALSLLDLGYSFNTANADEITAAAEHLKEQKETMNPSYVMDEIYDKIEGGEAGIAPYYNGDAVLIMREAPDMNIDFYIPDKTSIFIDSMCIPATSTNSEAAELYINYMCEATVAAANSYYVGYSTPIHAAYELLDKDLQENTIAYPDPEFLGSLDAFLTLPEDISSLMDEYWTEILAASNSVWIYAAALVAVIGGAAAFMTVKKNKRKKMDY